MPKIVVETKSRSKHVFETDESGVETLTKIIQEKGFSSMSYLGIQNTFFNPENVTSIKIEE